MNDTEKRTFIVALAVGGAAFMVYLASKQLRHLVRVSPLPTDPHPHNIPKIDKSLHVDSNEKYKRDQQKDTGLVKYGNQFVEYIYKHGVRIPSIQDELLKETKNRFPREFLMAGGKQVGAMLNNLIRVSGAKKGIEVGVFTGFTTLGMALALPEDGKIYALDVSDKFASLGQEFWKKANVDNKIELRIAPAEQTLNDLLSDVRNHGTFDFAFVDADKTGYDTYYEKLLVLLKKGGWIIFDNMFAFGYIASTEVPEKDIESVEAIRRLNEKLHHDSRVEVSLLEVCDGVNFVVKK
jgi:predicted O-methyltransferase YrrM